MTILTALWALFASALLASLTAWFQLRNWRNQDLVRLREKEQDAAIRVVSEFASLISKRIYRQKRFLWAVKNGMPEDDADVVAYRAVLLEWNDKLREIEARLTYSFGRDTMVRVEKDFHDVLARIHITIESNRGMAPNQSKGLSKAERSLNALGSRSSSFTDELMHRAREFNLSAFHGKDTISFLNRRNLSVGYLFLRLLGISDKSH